MCISAHLLPVLLGTDIVKVSLFPFILVGIILAPVSTLGIFCPFLQENELLDLVSPNQSVK